LTHLGDPGGADVRAALGPVDPAQMRPPVELRQRIEERARGRAGRERRGDVVGEIIPQRALRRQLDGHVIADAVSVSRNHSGVTVSAHPPPARESLPRTNFPLIAPPTGWSALAPHVWCLVRVERHGDDRAAARTHGHHGAEPLHAHATS
jgi:hypothetical protein